MSLSKCLSNKVFYWKFMTIFDLNTQILVSFLWHVIVISLHEQMWFCQQEPTEIQTAEINTFIQLLIKYSPTTRCILKQDHLWISLNYPGSKTSRHPSMFRAVSVPACVHTFRQSATHVGWICFCSDSVEQSGCLHESHLNGAETQDTNKRTLSACEAHALFMMSHKRLLLVCCC